MYIGVDFGTSFSQVAAYHNHAIADLNERGEYGIPSVFYYDVERGEVVGKEALVEGAFNAQNLVRDIKMKLGSQVTLDTKEFSANEIVGKIYGEIVKFAQQKGPEKIINFNLEGIVITHPAKFSMAEVNALSEAAKNCQGIDNPIEVVGALKEPVAAAIAYFNDANDQFENGDGILVFDLGGGTCDIALVEVNKDDGADYIVIDSDMERVGGRDWDKALYEYAKEKIEALTNGQINVDGNPDYKNDLYESVVTAKHTLSTLAQTNIRPRKIYHEALRRGIPITRASFMELTQDLLDKAIQKLVDVYQKHKDTKNIKTIICVGGSSNMPQVKDAIETAIPTCEVKRYNPESAVVNGAAIFATKIMENIVEKQYGLKFEELENKVINLEDIDPSVKPGEISLKDTEISPVLDFLSHSYGVRCRKSPTSNEFVVKNLLFKGTNFPATNHYDGFSVTTSATSVLIEIYESDSTDEIYPCDGKQNEHRVGTLTLYTPNGITVDDNIVCELTANDLTNIHVKAQDAKGENKPAEIEFNCQLNKN